MNAYLNELSFTPYPDRDSAKEGIQDLIVCLKKLDQFGIKNVKRSKLIDDKCLVGSESYQRMLNDKNLIDEDTKSVLINRMETLETEDELIDKHSVISMKYGSMDCKGLGWAANELENTIVLSFHKTIWERSLYNVDIVRLDDQAVEYTVKTSTRNVSTSGHIDVHHDFLASFIDIPTNGKVLAGMLATTFPNLIFAKSAVTQIKELKSEDSIAQIYFRLQDLQKVATVCNEHCSPYDFMTKATPESEPRINALAARLTFAFENNISYLCSWHLRFTPGAGRIHFYHQPAEKKIYVGYIGLKIQ